jgi:hypothetical protein
VLKIHNIREMKMKDLLGNEPAALTVAKGSLSRAAKNDIRNGTR